MESSNNWNYWYMDILLQITQAETRGEDGAKGKVSRGQRSLAEFSADPNSYRTGKE